MIRQLLAMVVLGGLVLLTGCEEQCNCYRPDYTPPAVPRGVTSVTGDREVYLFWYPNAEYDLAGYNVYVGDQPDGYYMLIGSTRSANYIDQDVINGRTYYYAVSAYDQNGNESKLSYDMVFDTPRPEGWGARLWDLHTYPDDAGYDFASHRVLPYSDIRCDIWLEFDEGIPFIWRANRATDIQDYGYMTSIDEINYAPVSGWIQMDWLELVSGHGYIVWTDNNHFAKLHVTGIGGNSITFDWAYQTDPGNPELKLVIERNGENGAHGAQ